MTGNISTAQLVGSCIEQAFWIAGGAYLAWLWPRRVRGDIQSGKISAEEGLSKLKKVRPLFGYLVMVYGIVRMVGVLL